MGSAQVVAVSMPIGLCFSYSSVHPEHRVRTLNVHQSKPALYTWLDRKKHCELGEKMLMAKQECIRYTPVFRGKSPVHGLLKINFI